MLPVTGPRPTPAEVTKLFLVFGKTLQFAYLFGVVPALMMAAVDDILLHIRRISWVVRLLIVGAIAFATALLIYGGQRRIRRAPVHSVRPAGPGPRYGVVMAGAQIRRAATGADRDGVTQLEPSRALPCDDDVERGNHRPQPFARPKQLRRGVSPYRAAWSHHRSGRSRGPSGSAGSAVRRLSIRVRHVERQSVWRAHPRAAAGAAPCAVEAARCRLRRARHQDPLRHRRSDRIGPGGGDIITTAISLWVVREARALGAPWYLTTRMLGNVALDGVVGLVPLAGDAFDVCSAPTSATCGCCNAGWTSSRAETCETSGRICRLSHWERYEAFV